MSDSTVWLDRPSMCRSIVMRERAVAHLPDLRELNSLPALFGDPGKIVLWEMCLSPEHRGRNDARPKYARLSEVLENRKAKSRSKSICSRV